MKNFDPETVIWTDEPIEKTLARDGVYKTAADIYPSGRKDIKTKVRNPFGSVGDPKYEFFNEWEYAEFCWLHFYPVGCGRLAAMVAGGIDNEVIQINEDTCWDGSPYGTLIDENGNIISSIEDAANAKKITTKDFTAGSRIGGRKYYRGANADGSPAPIGSKDAIVGDEKFREEHPDLADKSISYQALMIENTDTQEDVQRRFTLHRMIEAKFLGSPIHQRTYKSFAEVYIDFGHDFKKAGNYTKSLDMRTASVTTEYDLGGAHFRREIFASYPDQAIVCNIESNKPMRFTARLHTYHDKMCRFEKISDDEIRLISHLTDCSGGDEPGTLNAVSFEARMLIRGGKTSVSNDGSSITFEGTEAEIYIVGATNFVDHLTLDNTKPSRDCDMYTENIRRRTYAEIKSRHLADFGALFGRTEIHLGNTDGKVFDMPTEKRVRNDGGFEKNVGCSLAEAEDAGISCTYQSGDNALAALEANYGKYLLICGAREGREASGDEISIQQSRPLNLTGKWNASMSAAWNGKYTININTEMNYWAAQPLCLPECERTLIDALDELAAAGSVAAKNQYAIGDGSGKPGSPWAVHHNFDLWCGAQPIDVASAGMWPTGGAWLLDHAWQYFLFNRDKEYLAKVYPHIVGAAKFFAEFLVIDPVTGYLVTAASCSPEQGGVQPGAAMDTQLIRNLYDITRRAAKILGKEEQECELLGKIEEQMPNDYFGAEQGKLAPDIIGDDGLIKEWSRFGSTFELRDKPAAEYDYYVKDPFTGETCGVWKHEAGNNCGHRHCSHLWEMYPGIHLPAGGELYEAFCRSVTAKGAGEGKGWSLAWRMCLSARARHSAEVSRRIEQLLTTRTAPNMFDMHPPFQIDGNYGTAAGVLEALLDSHGGTVTFLPALPEQWSEGSIRGINTREGAAIDLEWNGGVPKKAVVHARISGRISIESPRGAIKNVLCENRPIDHAASENKKEAVFDIMPDTDYVIEF